MSLSRRLRCGSIPLLLIAMSSVRALAQTCAPDWDLTVADPGLNSTVWSVYGVGGGGAVGSGVYVGGQFSTAGGQTARNIARWDGTSWSPLGDGAVNGGTVHAITAAGDGSSLYAGGSFGSMGNVPGTSRIARWDGSFWHDVGGGMSQNNTGIRALTVFKNNLYAGGYLNEIGGIAVRKLAFWNGSVWSGLPGDPLGSTDVVRALIVYDDVLYIGGEFPDAGSESHARNIFRWNGETIEPLGRGVNDDVEAFAVYDGDLYVGGQFTEVYQSDGSAVSASKIARWDGSSWYAVGSGMDTPLSTYVWALAVFDDGGGEALYAGGSFTSPANRIARWDGAEWSSLGDGMDLNGYVYALSVWGPQAAPGLFVGGTFSIAGGESADRIAELRGPHPADLNCDGAVNLADHTAFTDCMAGPLDEPPSLPDVDCTRADLTDDIDADLEDHARLQPYLGD